MGLVYGLYSRYACKVTETMYEKLACAKKVELSSTFSADARCPCIVPILFYAGFPTKKKKNEQ